MQVGEVRVLNIGVKLFQVVAELHRRVGAEAALGTVVHLYTLVFPRMENVLADVLSTVGSEGDGEGEESASFCNNTVVHLESEKKKCNKMFLNGFRKCIPDETSDE